MSDLEGRKFGRLLVIRNTGRKQGTHAIFLCRCDCGNLIEIINSNIIRGNTKSCGCLMKDRASEANLKHGDARSRLYGIWCGMKSRCLKSNDSAYKYYGGRDIVICPEWKNNYLIFKAWALANGYADNLGIDRINNNGNYEPSNCQWITQSENSKKRNRENALRKNNGHESGHPSERHFPISPNNPQNPRD